MLMTEIRRKPLTNVAVISTEAMESLASEAESVLGYTALKSAVSTATSTDTKVLAQALLKLDIDVLNDADVKAYQVEQQKESTKKKFAEWLITHDSNEQYSYFMGCTWSRTPIGQYQQPVPDFVLNKAVQIKKSTPDCEIFISHLTENPDPFLLVQRKVEYTFKDYRGDEKVGKKIAEQYWIEVWDEPKFESGM